MSLLAFLCFSVSVSASFSNDGSYSVALFFRSINHSSVIIRIFNTHINFTLVRYISYSQSSFNPLNINFSVCEREFIVWYYLLTKEKCSTLKNNLHHFFSFTFLCMRLSFVRTALFGSIFNTLKTMVISYWHGFSPFRFASFCRHQHKSMAK